MGDAQVFSQTAIFNMDMSAFYKKWFQDIRDEQTPDGRLPNYAPYVSDNLRYYDAPGWADAGVIIPWKAYVNYGDKEYLRESYESMKGFINITTKNNPSLIRINEVGQNYGDWLNGNTIKEAGYPKEGGAIPKDVFSTAYFAYSTRLLANTAKILGEQRDFKYYDSLANKIKEVFISEFVDADGVVKGNTQAGYGMALEFDLIPAALKNKAVQHMVDAVKAYDYRISTGIHTTERMMNQLSINGHSDIAYQLLESHRFPSWMYSIDQGATTIWERWDGFVKGRGFQDPGMNSFNHYAIGSVGEWLYKHILGITPDESAPGYKHFFIQPAFNESLGWAKGSYHSVAGKIAVSWKNGAVGNSEIKIEIPVNTTATVILPNTGILKEGFVNPENFRGRKRFDKGRKNVELQLGSGKYIFYF